jgi:hypothetical protein
MKTINEEKPPGGEAAADLRGSESMPVPELGPDIKTRIGQQLRLMYGEVVNQGMPERFAEILRGSR